MAKRGRPTKYNPKFIQKAQEYLNTCVDEDFDWTKTDGAASTTYEHRIKVNLPMVEDFADFIGVNKTSLYEWAKLYPDFSNALSQIIDAQKKIVIKRSLSGDYNPLIAKLILSANHGMKEKSDITSNGESININVIKYNDDAPKS